MEPMFPQGIPFKHNTSNSHDQGSNGRTEPPREKRLLAVPVFRITDLDKKPEAALAMLYSNRPHQYHEDGLRFTSLSLLQCHTNAFLERKKDLARQKETKSTRSFRTWYCTSSEWITDFNARTEDGRDKFLAHTVGGVYTAHTAGSGQNGKEGGDAIEEEFCVPADERYTRCPVSKEMFEQVWDEDEGAFMYRYDYIAKI